jgi:hypothetical protein
MGSRHVYSVLGYGAHPIGGEDNRRDSLFAGLGGHLDFDPLWFELDAVSHWLHGDFDWLGEFERATDGGADWDWESNDLDAIHQLRITMGWRLVDQFSIFAGPTVNLLVSEERKEVGLIPSLWHHTTNNGVELDLTLGFLLGLQWEPKWGNLNSRNQS